MFQSKLVTLAIISITLVTQALTKVLPASTIKVVFFTILDALASCTSTKVDDIGVASIKAVYLRYEISQQDEQEVQ